MSKAIKTILLISVLLFALLQSASSQRLRSLQEEQSFNLEETDNTARENNSDDFELGEGDSTESAPDNAANYDLGDIDASAAPAPTTIDATLGASNQHDGSTSFVLGDDEETQTVSNTQKNAATTTESHEGEQSFELKEDEPVGASASDGDSFELKDDQSVGASGSDGEQSFELNEEGDASASLGASSGSHEDTTFELVDNDDTNIVDLTDPADASSSTDKNSGANNGGRALADATVSTTTTTTVGNAKSGVSLQTGIVMTLVAVVSALVL